MFKFPAKLFRSSTVITVNLTMASSAGHKVFVYGTLKRGEPNHSWFAKDNGCYAFLGEGRTVEKFPLIIGTKYNIPFLLYSPGKGQHVRGELYEVDDKVLSNVDSLEDHPNFYTREQHEVESGDKKTKPWIYFIKNFKPELLERPTYESYSSEGPHGLKYVARYQRGDPLDYKSEVLKS